MCSTKNDSFIKLWKISRKKYLFFLQFFCKIYLSLVAVYISQLARKIIDEDIFIKQPGNILLYFTVFLLTGIGVSCLYQYCINEYAIALSYRLKSWEWNDCQSAVILLYKKNIRAQLSIN